MSIISVIRWAMYLIAISVAYKMFGDSGFWTLGFSMIMVEKYFNPRTSLTADASAQPDHQSNSSVTPSQG